MNNYNDTRYPEANYKDQGLPEYNDNPLIAALPMIMSPVDVVIPPFLIELMGRKSKALLLFKNRWTTIY